MEDRDKQVELVSRKLMNLITQENAWDYAVPALKETLGEVYRHKADMDNFRKHYRNLVLEDLKDGATPSSFTIACLAALVASYDYPHWSISDWDSFGGDIGKRYERESERYNRAFAE